MGTTQTLRGRMAPALILAALLVLAAVVMLGVMARPAAALDTWSSTTCGSCHNYSSGDAFHSKTTHASLGCTATCHSTGFSTPDTGTCATAVGCHGGATSILAANAQHTSQGCGTTAGCHGVPNTPPPTATPTPTPTATAVATTLTAKVTPGIVKMGKKVKVTGRVGPADAKIGFKVVRKVGTKWVKMKAPATAIVSTTGDYTWTYKTVKKGAHKVTLTVKATTAYTFKTMSKSFKVK